jgi:hypothetical protein
MSNAIPLIRMLAEQLPRQEAPFSMNRVAPFSLPSPCIRGSEIIASRA